MSTILKTGPAPHIRTKETVESVMYDVVIALVPALLMAIYSFGVRALILTSVSVLTCIATEYLCQKALKRDIEAFDGSAILTGILFSFQALTVPRDFSENIMFRPRRASGS